MTDENTTATPVVDAPVVAAPEPVLTPAKLTLMQTVEALLHKAGADIEDDFAALKSWLKAEVSRL